MSLSCHVSKGAGVVTSQLGRLQSSVGEQKVFMVGVVHLGVLDEILGTSDHIRVEWWR